MSMKIILKWLCIYVLHQSKVCIPVQANDIHKHTLLISGQKESVITSESRNLQFGFLQLVQCRNLHSRLPHFPLLLQGQHH